MTLTAEEAIKIINQLPPVEFAKVREWIDEHQTDIPQNNTDKFKLALKWIEENKEEFDGQFVLLDGDKLIAHGKEAKPLYTEARKRGIEIPFVKRIKAKELPFGGW